MSHIDYKISQDPLRVLDKAHSQRALLRPFINAQLLDHHEHNPCSNEQNGTHE